jgi:hypothetical protein
VLAAAVLATPRLLDAEMLDIEADLRGFLVGVRSEKILPAEL